jgi:glycosyltransferase involved in cell wall biosynthesis
MKPPIPEHLRLCFFSQKLPRKRGSDNYGYLWPLCRSLAKMGHDVTVITSEGGDAKVDKVEGVEIHSLESPLGFGGAPTKESFLDRLEQLHNEKPFDLLHSVDGSGKFVAPFKKELKLTMAADISGIELDQIFGLLGLTEDTVLSYLKTSTAVTTKFLKSFFGEDHRLLKNADGVFVASPRQKDILELYYLIPSRRVYVIPYGINTGELPVPTPNKMVFEKWGVPAGAKVILTVTPLLNVEETKNLLTAFERVVIKKPSTALVIAGDGPKRKEIEFHMLQLALASKVFFTGQVTSEE